jgi:coenzyme F420 hydrogenase subunit beta
MMQRHPVEQIVADGHCMGCGFCTLAYEARTEGPRITMRYSPERDHWVPVVHDWQPGDDPGDVICPGRTMDMVGLAHAVHGHLPEDPVAGEVVSVRAGYAGDPVVRRKSASGGVTTALLAHLFEQGAIDVAYCAVPGEDPMQSCGRLVRSKAELEDVHGSIYHPVDFGRELHELVDGEERFAFVGLPCEVAALEMLKRGNPQVARRHVISIGLFCGGINSYGGIGYYLEGFGVPWSDVGPIDYRYGDWPGGIRLRRKSTGAERSVPRIHGNSRWKILRYVVAFQGYWMLQRCRMCPDQVSDFADVAVGDPHLPRFRKRGGEGFSAIIARTARGESLLREAIAAGRLREEPMSISEVIESQGYTLDNRRHCMAYRPVGKLFGMRFPSITVYPALSRSLRFRHYKYAFVDLFKIALPKWKLLRLLYLPWQVFEYLFVTFAPRLFWTRLSRLLRNR